MTREDDRWGDDVFVGETGQDLNLGTGLMAACLTSALLWEKTLSKRAERKRPEITGKSEEP